jgi:ELWxxDGT repeat protein
VETNCEPRVSDGTPAGTRLLADLRPGTEGGNPYAFAASP